MMHAPLCIFCLASLHEQKHAALLPFLFLFKFLHSAVDGLVIRCLFAGLRLYS